MKIYKKYYLERLYLIMIFIKLEKFKMMLKKMIILMMLKYTRFIKISMT